MRTRIVSLFVCISFAFSAYAGNGYPAGRRTTVHAKQVSPWFGKMDTWINGLHYVLDTASNQAWLIEYGKSLLKKHRLVIPSAVIADKRTFDVVYVNLNYHRSIQPPLKLKEVIISEGVTTIGYRAFAGFKSLKEVILPSTITHIENYAFDDCNLSMLTIPEGIEHIGNNIGNIDYIHILSPVPPDMNRNTNYWGRNDSHFVIPDGTIRQYLTTVGWELCGYTEKSDFDFYNQCWKMGWKKIGNSLYKFDPAIRQAIVILYDTVSQTITSDSVVIYKKEPYRITTIAALEIQTSELIVSEGITRMQCGDNMGYKSPNLKRIQFPVSLQYIENGAFEDYGHLQNITFQEGLLDIGAFAFRGCHALTSLALPQGLLRIGNEAFKDCENITELVLPESLHTIGREAFSNCHNLTDIHLPSTLRLIKSGAFRNCKRLQNIVLPDSVTELEGGVFYGCDSLYSIVLPESVKEVGHLGSQLKEIYCMSSTPPECTSKWQTPVDKEKAVVYVPYGALHNYRNAPGWKECKNLREMPPLDGNK